MFRGGITYLSAGCGEGEERKRNGEVRIQYARTSVGILTSRFPVRVCFDLFREIHGSKSKQILQFHRNFLAGIADSLGLALLAVPDKHHAELAVLDHSVVRAFAGCY